MNIWFAQQRNGTLKKHCLRKKDKSSFRVEFKQIESNFFCFVYFSFFHTFTGVFQGITLMAGDWKEWEEVLGGANYPGMWSEWPVKSILVYTLLVEILMTIVPHSTDHHIILIIILLLYLIYLITAWTPGNDECGEHFIQLNLKM